MTKEGKERRRMFFLWNEKWLFCMYKPPM